MNEGRKEGMKEGMGMDGWMDEWMDGWMDVGWMDGWIFPLRNKSGLRSISTNYWNRVLLLA